MGAIYLRRNQLLNEGSLSINLTLECFQAKTSHNRVLWQTTFAEEGTWCLNVPEQDNSSVRKSQNHRTG